MGRGGLALLAVLFAALFGVGTAGGAAAVARVAAVDCPPGHLVSNPGPGQPDQVVRRGQCLLNLVLRPPEYEPLPVDGVAGPETVRRLVRFQQCANALGAGLVVDGRFGAKTMLHLLWWAEHPEDFAC
ncbi:peptidoglycan-binding domain-containing protein [Actinosynnema pretiosum]|uniref:Peptidoglycan binding-like domain-containing protein n=1 Tax=Actinosynnema pretiosum TaxID=42197 RepID=A0A290Z448_9PSEU|nr:peptidoglycan-binding domain-containing protein [Actinosynnema pretiosum]ATE53733.1 hypothetical protein CNX65_10870 [Actinosynnema pretiosum]